MMIREALVTDIPRIQEIRWLVKENRLSDPALVKDSDVLEFITVRGKGWVSVVDDTIVGFAIADLRDNNVWALFIDPPFEGQGIGSALQDAMLDWYFTQGKDNVWLSTSPGTRAERFYSKSGWRKVGTHGKGEIKFEMTKADWKKP